MTLARITGAQRGTEAEMQVGLMAPQGWKGEYDGWGAADAWARTVELAKHAEAPVRVPWVGPLPRAGADRRDHGRVAVLAALAMATERSASATWSSAPGSATRP
jgi:hypothetical protein